MSAEQFDQTKQDIEGIIELNFNGSKYGVFFDDCPFGEERLIRWFVDLLTIAKKIKAHNYVAYRIPDSANLWLEFILQDKELCVSLVEDVDRELLMDLFVYKPYNEFRYSHWKGSMVSAASFNEEIIINAQKLLNFISVLNPQLLKSKNIQILENEVRELSL
ncbi:hypothetical protein [Paenibacillus brasilensis]|uniref:Uncharacterized protein n=1 Tax=Paenibacillus brasilensis TaxID=128574 RepID=A0ABU0L7C3_9BACL|nr:hypothetical protein [Paenibacillus brasilensis]MDQ0497192.1 hypothetical protein [Paenibacillus brasilensis]